MIHLTVTEIQELEVCVGIVLFLYIILLVIHLMRDIAKEMD